MNRLARRVSDPARWAFMLGLHEARTPLVAIGTWAFVTGIAMVKTGMTEGMAVLMTLLVYAGSAQLTALPLMEAGAPVWLIFLAGMVVNVRFVIFGAALQPFFQRYKLWQRAVIGFLISDVAFVLFIARYGNARKIGTTRQLWYFLGMIIPCWIVWNVMSILGVYLGGLVPQSWGLDFAAVLALLAIVVPLVRGRPMIMCLLVASVVAWAGQVLPLRLGLAAAVIAGVVAGVAAEQHVQRGSTKGAGHD